MGDVLQFSAELGDPVFRDAMARLWATLGDSTSGRYMVLTEDPVNKHDVHRFMAYGPFGKGKAIDVAAAVTADLTADPATKGVKVRVIAWVDGDGLS
jgi:hypothetical protein